MSENNNCSQSLRVHGDFAGGKLMGLQLSQVITRDRHSGWMSKRKVNNKADHFKQMQLQICLWWFVVKIKLGRHKARKSLSKAIMLQSTILQYDLSSSSLNYRSQNTPWQVSTGLRLQVRKPRIAIKLSLNTSFFFFWLFVCLFAANLADSACVAVMGLPV